MTDKNSPYAGASIFDTPQSKRLPTNMDWLTKPTHAWGNAGLSQRNADITAEALEMFQAELLNPKTNPQVNPFKLNINAPTTTAFPMNTGFSARSMLGNSTTDPVKSFAPPQTLGFTPAASLEDIANAGVANLGNQSVSPSSFSGVTSFNNTDLLNNTTAVNTDPANTGNTMAGTSANDFLSTPSYQTAQQQAPANGYQDWMGGHMFNDAQIAGLAQGGQVGLTDGSVAMPETNMWGDMFKDMSTTDMWNTGMGVVGMGLGAYNMNKQLGFLEDKIGIAKDDLEMRKDAHKATQSRRGFV